VIREIEVQDADKSYGADGIHIRFLKATKDTAMTVSLLRLYNRCLAVGRTPSAWNSSEIYLLTKDPTQSRNAGNLRPISIICLFRKIFERLLLQRFENELWAGFHPAQAGFRRTYSTYTNVALVHSLLSSKERSMAVFLDFKSAFDVLDHERLSTKLVNRSCPAGIVSLISGLMFYN